MTRSTSTDWEAGYSPWDAVAKFADSKLWNEYAPLQSRFCFPVPEDLIQPAPIDYNPPPMQDPLRDFTRFTELDAELKDWMLCGLQSGDFVAVAYPKIRLRGAKPIQLTLLQWKAGKYSWDCNELWAADAEYGEIRVLPVVMENLHRKRSSEEKPKRGRPSYNKEVLTAWSKLAANGELAKCSSLKSTFPKIRRLMEADNPEIEFRDREPSDSALYKILASLWDQERLTSK
jgi:hypothetical protein